MAENSNASTSQQKDRELILTAKKRGTLAKLFAYARLSGPGWLQSGITLGGGSLAGSLYVGMLGGMSLLWVQPVAMILGIIMLSAISYVTLSTGERPFHAINHHVNPVLGWGWAVATLMANLVWSFPQFSLGAAVLRQNLMPGVLGSDALPELPSRLIACFGILAVSTLVVWSYDRGYKGTRILESVLKLVVTLTVLCFVGVVAKLTFSEQGLNWREILGGFVPDLRLLSSPPNTFNPYLEAIDPQFRDFWTSTIVRQQRDVMISVIASAVGINMTFLMPYALLKRGWDKAYRGLAIFDLSTGLFIPFVLATSCVVIASASQFHAIPAAGLLDETDESGVVIQPPENLQTQYLTILEGRIRHEIGNEELSALTPDQKAAQVAALPLVEKRMAAMLVRRDAFNLAESLSPLTGDVFAHYVFGFGVLGMVVSTVIILMLINGFVVCEMIGIESKGWPYRLGCLAPGIGALAPFVWTGSKTQFWLAVPTSLFGMTLLPIAYITFFLLMNQKSLLGESMAQGQKRIAWNSLMALAAGMATVCSLWSLWSNMGWTGIGVMGAFVLLVLVAHVLRSKRSHAPGTG